MRAVAVLVALLAAAAAFAVTARAQQCGWQAGGKLCPNGLCCSKDGYCGSTDPWCGDGCQSQCDGGGGDCGGGGGGEEEEGGDGVASIISRSLFEEMLMHRNYVKCPGRCFYTYDAFIAAAKFFPGFGTTGDLETQKRELAAFLGQTSHETTGGGGWPDAPDGPYAWGYCFKEEVGGPATPDSQYCKPSERWPCVPGKKYYGRGPIQLSYNYNYGQAGEAEEIATDLLSDPDLVASDAVVSFKTAIWFWMTPQAPKPSCHDVMTGQWVPSPNDITAGRLPGYGVTTNIINGGLECGFPGPDDRVEDRIGFYKRYCDLLGVSYGDNLDCYNQRNFGATSTSSSYHADA